MYHSYPPVICVDLDGTLVRTDTLLELVAGLLREQPWILFHCLFWLAAGKARLKAELARRVSLSVDCLPYNKPLIAYLRREKDAGREVVLATAANHEIAQQVAEHLQLFDAVIASDDTHNLRGPAKAEYLRERYGERGFAYAGNDRTDLPIWHVAGSAIVVGRSEGLARAVPGEIEATFITPTRWLRDCAKAARVYQWLKNILVFVPLATAGSLFDLAMLGRAVAAFAAFSLCASGIYLLNDLTDLEADRAHEHKRHRPFASGSLSLYWGLLGGPTLVAIGLGLSLVLQGWLTVVLLLYVGLASAYSVYFKTKPLVDVFILAVLYTLRVVAGSVAVAVPLSTWLLSFVSFLFLSLAFLKRVVELQKGRDSGQTKLMRRDYYREEEGLLTTMGTASSFAAAVVLALYIDTNIATEVYSAPQMLWGLVPLCLFWLCRLWLLACRGYVDDDPIVYVAKDWVSWLTGATVVLIYSLAFLGIPGHE